MRFWGFLLAFAGSVFASTPELSQAAQLYARTQYREALQILAPLSASREGAVQEMIGKSYFMLGGYKKAVEALEKAVAADPGNSVYYHWLGKAHGRRAETANPLLAPGHASRARQAFEKAVALNDRNIEAINDLFTYYIEAPGFLGGSLDKAQELAKKIQAIDSAEYQYAMAKLAEKRKEYKSAEAHFRRAVEIAPRQVGRIIDLAKFLSKHGRDQESEAAFAQAEKVAPDAPRLLFERASTYIRSGRNLSTARALLERYLRSPLTPDDPPRADAERLLKQAAGA